MSILKNAPQPELIPTYDGSNQSTHPSVLQFTRRGTAIGSGWQ